MTQVTPITLQIKSGLLYALAACFVWGFIFVIPQFITGFSSVEVALGRYLFFGLFSALIFLKTVLKKRHYYPLPIWIRASFFSLISTFVYYTFLILALRFSSPPICALIIGISPITIAFYGNWRQKEISFRHLILPSFFILIGLIIINVPHLATSSSPSSYLLGLLFSFFSLIAWSWYVVANSRFLKSHPEIHSIEWSTLIGFTTLIWVALFTLILTLFFKNLMHVEKYFIFNAELKSYLIGSAILGLLCSWVGAFLWNKASLYLPVSLAGQLTIFETIFGLLFLYLAARNLPSLFETIGIAILMAAILYGIRSFAKNKPRADQLI
jgi:drug/metabolite transporter (DMT)-like permease